MKHYIVSAKMYKLYFLLQNRPLCHDSATIYLQFNSKLDSYTIIYCQLDRKKNKKEILCVQREILHLAHLLVLELMCFANSFPMSMW